MFNLEKETLVNITSSDGEVFTLDKKTAQLIKKLELEKSNNNYLPDFHNISRNIDSYSDVFLRFYSYLILNHKLSNSHIYQDLFVLFCFDQKRKGVFLELTTNHEIESSNNKLLEDNFDWSGITFNPDFQRIKCSNKIHQGNKITNKSLNIKKQVHISLNDIFINYFKSSPIDYFSLDVKGRELDIFNNFNFKKYSPTIITIKYGYNENQLELENLLSKNNYLRFFKEHTYPDAWYILQI